MPPRKRKVKTLGQPSALGLQYMALRARRTQADNAARELLAVILQSNARAVENGCSTRSSYSETGPTASSIRAALADESTMMSRRKRNKVMKWQATERLRSEAIITNAKDTDDFAAALDNGSCYMQIDGNELGVWGLKNAGSLATHAKRLNGDNVTCELVKINYPTAHPGAVQEQQFKAAVQAALAKMSFDGCGLSKFGDDKELTMDDLDTVYPSDFVDRIWDELGDRGSRAYLEEGTPILRKHIMKALEYLLYFGIGGKTLSGAAKHMKSHLNGRASRFRRDPAFNHMVSKDKFVRTTIFQVDGNHIPQEVEDAGIDIISETGMQTNLSASTANYPMVKKMFYYLIVVINPEFTAAQVRASKDRAGQGAGGQLT
jgi:hypothetical protein